MNSEKAKQLYSIIESTGIVKHWMRRDPHNKKILLQQCKATEDDVTICYENVVHYLLKINCLTYTDLELPIGSSQEYVLAVIESRFYE